MKKIIKTAPTAYPLGLKEVKQHLNITVGWTEDDDYLDALIKVATDRVEQFTRRRLVSQTWYAYLDEWPDEDYLTLPFGQLQSVTSVKYTDSSNTQITTFTDTTTATTDDYKTDINSDPGRIVLDYGDGWPSVVMWPVNPIVIEFVCGYGGAAATATVSAAAVPSAFKHAMKLLIEDMYNTRGTEIIGQGFTVSRLKTVEALLTPKRIPSTYIGLQGLYK